MNNNRNKVISYVKRLNDCILDSEGNVKSYISGEIKEFKELSDFDDKEDRIEFLNQFIEWLMNSDYMFNSTKEFLRQSNVGVKEFFESRNRAIVRYNSSCESERDKRELYVVNTCITRVQTDRKKLETIIDNDFWFNMFENVNDDWKRYSDKFIKESKKVNRLVIDKRAFVFDIDNKVISTSITKPKFDSLLDIINKYSRVNMEKELAKLDRIQLGYLSYLCTIIPQKVKDKDNYDRLMSVINGTYDSDIEEIVEDLDDSQSDYDRLMEIKKELEEKEAMLIKMEEDNKHKREEDIKLLERISYKMKDILQGPSEDYVDRFNTLAKYIDNNILGKNV